LPAAAIDLGKAPTPAKDLSHTLGALGYGEQRQLPGELDGGLMTHLRAGQRVQGSPDQDPLGARRCGERCPRRDCRGHRAELLNGDVVHLTSSDGEAHELVQSPGEAVPGLSGGAAGQVTSGGNETSDDHQAEPRRELPGQTIEKTPGRMAEQLGHDHGELELSTE
jgi:hypothetical protein